MITGISHFNQKPTAITFSGASSINSLRLKETPAKLICSSSSGELGTGLASLGGLFGAVGAFSYSITNIAADFNPKNLIINGLFALGGLIAGAFVGGGATVSGGIIKNACVNKLRALK